MRIFGRAYRPWDTRGHHNGTRTLTLAPLDAFELDVEDAGQRADQEGLGQARHAHQQTVAAGEDGGEHLFDHVGLADDDFLKFFLHQPAMLAELLQHVAEVSGFSSGQFRISSFGLRISFVIRSFACFAILQWYHSTCG